MLNQKKETIALLLVMVIMVVFTGLLLAVKSQYAKRDTKITMLNAHLQKIFDAEVQVALNKCNPQIRFIPVNYFPEYDVDCDDLSVISDPDPEMEGI